MKINSELQADVQKAIKWEPLLDDAEIGVIANDGIITLTGTVDSYAKKMEAEHAARNVKGVKAIVEKIEIRFPSTFSRTNLEIANEVLSVLQANTSVPKDKVKVKVEEGWITLEGELPWNYQKETAESAIRYLSGVKGVTNNINIKPESNDNIDKKDVEDAIARSWMTGENDINVNGTTVTLTGIIKSWYQKGDAARIA